MQLYINDDNICVEFIFVVCCLSSHCKVLLRANLWLIFDVANDCLIVGFIE